MPQTANFNQSRNDLYWSIYAGEDGTIRWTGYDDANWWNNVAHTDHARRRVGKVTGRVFVLNHDTGEVTTFDPAGPDQRPPQNPAPSAVYPSGDERVQPDGPLSGEVKRGGRHTPRPWRAVMDHNGRHEIRGPGAQTVAVVFHTPDGLAAENADLIAAAPRLLDELVAIEEIASSRAALDFNEAGRLARIAGRALAAIASLRPPCPICEDTGRATWLDDCQECGKGQGHD